jgi:hypothetical protein
VERYPARFSELFPHGILLTSLPRSGSANP